MKQLVEFLINSKSTGIISDPNFVDLGLSVLWGKCNLGADKPEDTGLYYMWGYTNGYSTHQQPTNEYRHKYIDCLDGNDKYNNYNTVLLPEDDAATKQLGKNCRMPMVDEIKELFNKCNFTETKNGIICAGSNDNEIFIPKTGYIDHNGSFSYKNLVFFLSKEFRSSNDIYIFHFDELKQIDFIPCINFLPIRPVKEKS